LQAGSGKQGGIMQTVSTNGAVAQHEFLQTWSDFQSLDLVQFDQQDVCVLFNPETFQLFRLGKLAASIVREARSGTPLSELSAKYGLSVSRVEHLIAGISKAVKAAPKISGQCLPQYGNFLGPDLGKLVLMVNNYCNLKCAYCYELNTVFSRKAVNMPRVVIETALEKFFAAFRAIETLMFIGGEPTLSEDAIETACACAIHRAQQRGCPAPKFSMVTNGSRMTERMFDIIGRYAIQVTFSLDGPKAVHDLVRIRHDDTGSYDVTSKNIHRYASMLKDKLFIEATVTRAHKTAGLTASDLIEFFASEFDLKSTHIVPAGLAKDDPLNPYSGTDSCIEEEFEQAAAKSIANIFDEMLDRENEGRHSRGSLDSVGDMLRTIVSKDARMTMCPAGTTQLVVDAFGDLYPCWMFAGEEQFKMGNILADDVFNPGSMKLLQRIHDNTKTRNPQCSTCYARYVCHACIGNNQHSTGSIEATDERYCSTVRNSLKTVLVHIGEIRQDPARWERLQAVVAQARDRQQKC
jgi:uncharacterized protein